MSRQASWTPGLITAPGGRRWLRLAMSHYRYVSERRFRRALLRDLRKAMRQLPDVYLDVWIQCRDDRSCCRLEDLQVTSAKFNEAVEDWAGARTLGCIGQESYNAARAAGLAILLPSGELVP